MQAATAAAHFIRQQLPPTGLFAGQQWRITPNPFPLGPGLAQELESLGRLLLQFNKAANLLYRKSLEGKQPHWIATWLDQGKPAALLQLQQARAFKNQWPRVIRPDLLLTDTGIVLTELDSVPGGIGLTAWLNQTYSTLPNLTQTNSALDSTTTPRAPILGGQHGMLNGFTSIFGDAARVHIVISKESATYKPEMLWLADQLGPRFAVRDPHFTQFQTGDAVYRFFELFDLANVPSAPSIFDLARQDQISLTPPPKMFLEEKLLFALLWNRNLHGFWRQELGQRFFERLLQLTPYTWLVDPAPLPPHAAIPELNLTDWHQLKTLSQRDRNLVLKVSGFSELAWGARGVFLGSDLPAGQWSAAVDNALRSFAQSPFILQRFHKPSAVPATWYDFDRQQLRSEPGRVRLCPYYFVSGEGDAARAVLGGVLATICPADKKIIHGMKEAILAPCTP